MTYFQPLKEESLASIVCRWASVTGCSNEATLFQPFINYRNHSIRLFPAANNELADALQHIFDAYGPERYIKDNTVLPLYNLTYHCDLGRSHLSDIIERPKKGQISYTQRELDCIEYKSVPVKFCSECFKEQMASYGFRWVRREWLLEVASTCFKHKILLTHPSCATCDIIKKPMKALRASLSGFCETCRAPINYVAVEKHFHSSSAKMARYLMSRNYGAMAPELRLYLLRECALRIGVPHKAGLAQIMGSLVRKILRDRLIDYDSNQWRYPHHFNTHKTFQYRFLIKSCESPFSREPVSCLYLPLSLSFKRFCELDEVISTVSERQPREKRYDADRLVLKEEFKSTGSYRSGDFRWGRSLYASSNLKELS